MFHTYRSRLLPLAVAAVLALTACGDDADEDSGGELSDGWTPVETEEFSISLPPGWFDGQRALEDEEFLAELAGELDGLGQGELADTIRNNIGDLDMLAYKSDDFDSGFSTNINVNAGERGPADEIDQLAELLPDELASVGASSIEIEDVDVNGVPALEVAYDLPDIGAKGIQHYLVADEAIVVATYTAAEPDTDLWRSVVDTIEIAG